MQELVGRLTALDPQASETLRIVSYFDVLVGGGVGAEAVVRGAAVLSGVVAGVQTPRGTLRVSAEGDRLASAPDEVDPAWPVRAEGASTVWIERIGAPHANDAMVLERFALAMSVVEARSHPAGDDALSIVIDSGRSAQDRAAAGIRLGVGPRERVRICATAPATTPPGGPSTLVATPHGVLRATLVRTSDPADAPAGLGTWGSAGDLPRSWADARAVLRLATGPHDLMDAEDFGIVLAAARHTAQAAPPHPDVVRLVRLDDRTRRILHALVEAESVRAAALSLGMHHSTLQARHAALTRELGYDPRSALGRARYGIADPARRLLETLAAES